MSVQAQLHVQRAEEVKLLKESAVKGNKSKVKKTWTFLCKLGRGGSWGWKIIFHFDPTIFVKITHMVHIINNERKRKKKWGWGCGGGGNPYFR